MTISRAITDLRRANLLEVRYDDIPTGGALRWPNLYVNGPLYDPAALERSFKKLEEVHGADRVKRARQWASIVYEDSDLGGIEALLEYETRFGRTTIEKAVEVVKKKSPSNPKRNMGYLLGTIEGIQREGDK